MRAPLVIAIVAAMVAAARAQGGGDPAPALIEISTPRASVWVHEAVRITIRIAYDAKFFREQAIQTTRQGLDPPVLLEASFLRDMPDATLVDEPAPAGSMPFRTIVGNDGLVRVRPAADRIVAGRTYAVVELERRVVFGLAGPRVIGGPTLRYTYATRFDEDLVGGSVPVDRREGFVAAEDLALTIKPLPDEGRPPGFGGAVGRFTIEAEADRKDVAVGESVKLRVTIAGDGNLASFAAPRPAIPGFKVLGVLERHDPGTRILTYDVAPTRSDVAAIPSIPFTYFEPAPRPRYATVRTEPIAITVRPGAASAPESRTVESRPSRLVAGQNDVYDVEDTGIPRGEAAYHAGRFAESIAIFEGARERGGARPADIDLAVGTALYRMGRLAEAIVAFRRALRAAPRDARALFNLEFAERELGVAPSSRPRGAFTAKEVAALGAVLASVGVALLLTSRRRRPLQIVGITLVLAALGCGAWAAHATWFAEDGEAVVVADEITVRVDPHAEVAVLARLRAGETVAVVEMTDRWVRLVHPSASGWTERQGVEPVRPFHPDHSRK